MRPPPPQPSEGHPVIYPDEHGDWAAANRGAALSKLRALRDWFEVAKLFPVLTETQAAEIEQACAEGVKAIEQRDELLAVTKRIVQRAGKRAILTLSTVDLDELRAAIARVEGK